MNKVFKVIYSKVRGCFVVVSEFAKNHVKSCSSKTPESIKAGSFMSRLRNKNLSRALTIAMMTMNVYGVGMSMAGTMSKAFAYSEYKGKIETRSYGTDLGGVLLVANGNIYYYSNDLDTDSESSYYYHTAQYLCSYEEFTSSLPKGTDVNVKPDGTIEFITDNQVVKGDTTLGDSDTDTTTINGTANVNGSENVTGNASVGGNQTVKG
ncbi:MAG: ESPR domain-containing protein, partial [Phascolarctobacterium sp.]|nr:ESPR domain-containing protein [Phascolarctobacterium sp.]